MRRSRALVAALAWAILALGCRTEPIRDVIEAPLPPHDAKTVSEIDEAIWRASRKLDWQAEIVEPGKLEATLQVRGHAATVLITHDLRSFSIRYQDSRNFDHDSDRIHRNYNHWVHRLKLKIQDEDC